MVNSYDCYYRLEGAFPKPIILSDGSPDNRAHPRGGARDYQYTNPDEPLCQGTIRRILLTTAKRANVDKPVNPHNFRHFWTTIMKQGYGLNDEEIKLLLGHKRESNGLNVVYNHSTTEKLLGNAELKLGENDDPIVKPLTPDRCGACGEDLQAHWVCCPVCGTACGP